jgi:hypothetical protein
MPLKKKAVDDARKIDIVTLSTWAQALALAGVALAGQRRLWQMRKRYFGRLI